MRLINTNGKPAVDQAEELAQEIKEAIYRYDGVMPVATAVGVLEIVKQEIMAEADQ